MLLDANGSTETPAAFAESAMQGLGASTLMSPRSVVQRRSHRGAVGVIRAAQLLAGEHPGARTHPAMVIQNGGDLTVHDWSAAGDPPRCEAVWTLQPRVLGTANHPKDLSRDGLVEYAHTMLGPVMAQLRQLEAHTFDDLGWCVGGTRVLTHQIVGHGPLISIAARKFGCSDDLLKATLGDEPTAEWVTSHGDAIIGNVVRDGNRFTLIDWECLGPLPAQRDVLRLFSYPAKYLPLGEWAPLEEALWGHAHLRLPSWTREDFHRGCNWSLVREFVAFPTANPEPIAQKIRAHIGLGATPLR